MSDVSRQRYVREILESFRATPGTRGRVRPADRSLAEELFRRGVPVHLVQAAFSLAAGRRTFRDPERGQLQPIASLHYFLPVIDEIQKQPLDPEYLEHIQDRLRASDRDHRSA